MVKQISVFLENKSGRLLEVCEVLGKVGVNIRALSLADTLDFGILRLIVDDSNKATGALRDGGFTVKETEVLAVEVKDRPGGLGEILAVLAAAGANVEYMYAFVEKSGEEAVVVFRVEDTGKGAKLLGAKGVKMLTSAEVAQL